MDTFLILRVVLVLTDGMQVVVLNKVDLPHVKEKQAEIEKALKAVSAVAFVKIGRRLAEAVSVTARAWWMVAWWQVIPHSRFMSISAMKKVNTQELMQRVRCRIPTYR